MTARSAFIRWAVLGAVVASLLTWAQAAETGGIAGLLQVGETSALRPIIEDQLGDIPLAPGPGHDGQIFYAIGIDLTGDEVGSLFDHAAYRYRRILYPLVSSAFGVLDGYQLLWGMIIVSIAATAAASGSVASMAVSSRRSEWLGLVVILNPGIWLSTRLLTSDTMALALMVAGLSYVTSKRRSSTTSLALSTLAKDVYLITPLGIGASRDRRRWVTAAVPVAVLLLWMIWLTITLGDGFTGRGNLAFPLTGIVEGARNWTHLDTGEWVYLIFALSSVLVGLFFGVWKRTWLRWPILGWSLLGIFSSNWVWDFGNNAARAFAPIAVLVALSLADPARRAGHTDTTDLEVAADSGGAGR